MAGFYPWIDGIAGKPMKTKSPLLDCIGLINHHKAAMAAGAALALAATLAAIGLLSLSGWFLAAAAFAGLDATAARAFNFFIPSIGVRLFAMTRTAARYGERILSHDATFRILETLRIWCYRKIEPLAPARLEQHHSGDLLTRITTDIDTLDNLYLRVLSPTVVAAIVCTLILGFIAHFHPLIAMVTAGALAAAGVAVPMLASRVSRSDARRLNEQTAHLRAALVDGIHGLAALLTCEAGPRYLDRIDRLHQQLVQCQSNMSRVTGVSGALTHLVSGLAVIGTLVIGIRSVAAGVLSGPMLALLVLTVMASFDAVAALPAAYQFLGQTRKAARRLHTITTTKPAVSFPPNPSETNDDLTLRFHRVYFRYPQADETTLVNIDWTIAPKRRVAVMGPTGSGKSTLLYLLARFEDPGRGAIHLGDRPLADYTEADLRRRICITDQHAHIFNGTLRDNLALAKPQAAAEEMMQALSAVQLEDFVQGLPDGLDTWVGEAGRLLSGGQARRVAVARALLRDAPIWVFDEPTEGLDSRTATAMLGNLFDRAAGKTIIMITHRAEALRQMDQIAVMLQGRIVAVDSPDNLYRGNEVFQTLVNGPGNRYV
jgi:ATP-binding cassette subfamily C protein CydC